MKERPILMTPENAQKVFDGTKTQTRRIMNPQPPEWCESFGYSCFTPKGSISARGTYKDEGPGEKFFKCPYGIGGDRLYVREGYLIKNAGKKAIYRGAFNPGEAAGIGGMYGGWKNAMFMPKKHARTLVTITDIQVERVQDIQEEDAEAEGAAFVCEQCGNDLDTQEGSEVHAACDDLGCNQGSYREGFRRLWNSINGKDSWAKNPYVWVLSFRRIHAS